MGFETIRRNTAPEMVVAQVLKKVSKPFFEMSGFVEEGDTWTMRALR